MDDVAPWLYTLAFGATGIHSAVLLALRPHAVERVMYALHLVMSASMVAMGWEATPLWVGQLAVFSAGTVYCGVIWLRSIGPRGASVAEHPPWMLGFHTLTLAVMVWMLAPGEHAHHGDAGLDAWYAMLGALMSAGLLAGAAIAVTDAVVCFVRRPPRWRWHLLDDAAATVMGVGMAAMTLGMAL